MGLISLIGRLGMALALIGWCAPGNAQDYPNRAVKIIIPYGPGGGPDVVARIVANQLSTKLGQPFIVENYPGALGTSATTAFLKSPADGYTFFVADASHWAIFPAMHKLPYDPLKDFVPVSVITESPLFLVVHGAMPVNTVQELVALIRTKPGAFSYASVGVGSIHHLTMEAFKGALGLDILHVPYKGSGQAIPALVGGQVSMALAGMAGVSGFAKDGRVKILAVNSQNRSSLAPTVPPMADAGIPDFDFSAYIGLLARAGTPRTVIDKLSASLGKASLLPETIARFANIGLEPAPDATPERFGEIIRQDVPKFARVVKITGIAADK